jgi:pyruvate formate lyase activating enzyme
MTGRSISTDVLLQTIEKDIIFYDESGGGVTFSGGEPLMQPEFLEAMLTLCRQQEIHTVVDTSGFCQPAIFDSVCPQVDLFLYDIKVIDDARHKQITGVSNRWILENLRHLAELGRAYILRLTLIPGFNDDKQALDLLAEIIISLAHRPIVELLTYHQNGIDKYNQLGLSYPLAAPEPRPSEHVQALRNTLVRQGIEVRGPAGPFKET